jgi:hypothetical protein
MSLALPVRPRYAHDFDKKVIDPRVRGFQAVASIHALYCFGAMLLRAAPACCPGNAAIKR